MGAEGSLTLDSRKSGSAYGSPRDDDGASCVPAGFGSPIHVSARNRDFQPAGTSLPAGVIHLREPGIGELGRGLCVTDESLNSTDMYLRQKALLLAREISRQPSSQESSACRSKQSSSSSECSSSSNGTLRGMLNVGSGGFASRLTDAPSLISSNPSNESGDDVSNSLTRLRACQASALRKASDDVPHPSMMVSAQGREATTATATSPVTPSRKGGPAGSALPEATHEGGVAPSAQGEKPPAGGGLWSTLFSRPKSKVRMDQKAVRALLKSNNMKNDKQTLKKKLLCSGISTSAADDSISSIPDCGVLPSPQLSPVRCQRPSSPLEDDQPAVEAGSPRLRHSESDLASQLHGWGVCAADDSQCFGEEDAVGFDGQRAGIHGGPHRQCNFRVSQDSNDGHDDKERDRELSVMKTQQCEAVKAGGVETVEIRVMGNTAYMLSSESTEAAVADTPTAGAPATLLGSWANTAVGVSRDSKDKISLGDWVAEEMRDGDSDRQKLSASSSEVDRSQRVTSEPLVTAMQQVGAADHGLMMTRSSIATSSITLANLLRAAAGQLQHDSSPDSPARPRTPRHRGDAGKGRRATAPAKTTESKKSAVPQKPAKTGPAKPDATRMVHRGSRRKLDKGDGNKANKVGSTSTTPTRGSPRPHAPPPSPRTHTAVPTSPGNSSPATPRTRRRTRPNSRTTAKAHSTPATTRAHSRQRAASDEPSRPGAKPRRQNRGGDTQVDRHSSATYEHSAEVLLCAAEMLLSGVSKLHDSGCQAVALGARGATSLVGEFGDIDSQHPERLVAAAQLSSPPSEREQLSQEEQPDVDVALSPALSDEDLDSVTSSPSSSTTEDTKSKLVARCLLKRSTSRARNSSGVGLIPKSRGSLSPLRQRMSDLCDTEDSGACSPGGYDSSSPSTTEVAGSECGTDSAVVEVSFNIGGDDCRPAMGNAIRDTVGDEDDMLRRWASELPSLLLSGQRVATPKGERGDSREESETEGGVPVDNFKFNISEDVFLSSDDVF